MPGQDDDAGCSLEASRLFRPYRALGMVSSHTPVVVQSRQGASYVTSAIGTAFQVMDLATLHLKFVSTPLPLDITALAVYRDATLAAAAAEIYVFQRARLVRRIPAHNDAVSLLLVLADRVVSAGHDARLLLWSVPEMLASASPASTPLPLPDEQFMPTALLHPATYLNKILVAGNDGRLCLVNIRSCSVVYEFRGWGSGVTALAQSPAVDVVAIGLADGRILLHNLRYDRTLMTFEQAEGAVTALSFRTDNQAVLASAGAAGLISLWDLERQQLATLLRDAHDGIVSSLVFLPAEPILVSSGPDNSLKVWVFDQPDGTGRLLRQRSGHASPPSRVRFHDANHRFLLSAGTDRAFRVFSTIQDQQNTELSQGRVIKRSRLLHARPDQLKLAPIVDFAVSSLRERDWDSIVTCHTGNPVAYTWRFYNRVIGKHELKSTDPRGHAPLRAVAISQCGNHAFTGSSSGWIDRFSMQSGRHRGCFRAATASSSCAHDKPITGLACDALNRFLVSCSLDGTLRYWSIGQTRLHSIVPLGVPLTQLVLHHDSGLLAVAADDLTVRVVDLETQRVVRRFSGHTGRITDIGFAADAHWLVSASMDSTVCTWDMASGARIDAFRTESPATGVALSPNNEYLATSHVDTLGIMLWSNRTQYENVFVRPLPRDHSPALLAMARPIVDQGERDAADDDDGDDVSDDVIKAKQTTPLFLAGAPQQHGHVASDADTNASLHVALHGVAQERVADPADGLAVLSGLPRARWATLSRLDVIKERNRPTEAPKAPPAAPFFLPTLPGVRPTFAVAEGDEGDGDGKDTEVKSRILPTGEQGVPESKLASVLALCHGRDATPLADHLASLGPSAIDAAVRMLEPDRILRMLQCLTVLVQTRQRFELVQAWLHLFLSVHGEFIVEHIDEAAEVLESLDLDQTASWAKMQSLFTSSVSLIHHFADIQ